MRWKKLGKIFDPTQFRLPNDCFQFAQSPQAIVFRNSVRIYFSSREIDKNNGKYLSHVAFVDMQKNLRDIIRVSDQTVIPLGALGCFDEHGIFPISPVAHGDAIYAYTCGWSRRVSVSVDTGVGLAISHDGGLTFQRVGSGPVLTSSLYEPYLVGDGYVKVINGTFHMWYIFGVAWKRWSPDSPPERVYKIGHATSRDGISWVKEEGRKIISDRIGEDESQALPSVIKIGDRYHMFFCYRQSFEFRKNKDRAYKIGHAYSEDLDFWIRDDESPTLQGSPGEWDSDMQCYPNVFECDGKTYLLYNGNEFGRYGFGLAELEL